MNRKLLFLFVALAAVAVLAAGCGSIKGEAEQRVWADTVPDAISKPQLVAWWPSRRVEGFKRTQIALALPKAATEVEKVTLYAPAGFGLDLAAAPGTGEGLVFLGTKSELDFNDLMAADPQDYENSPRAQACAPGQHAGAWVADLQFEAGSRTVVFFVDPTSGPDTALGSYELQVCLPLAHLSSPGGNPLGESMHYLVVAFSGLTAPIAPQPTLWRAYLSNPDGTGAPDQATTYELRSNLLLPTSLSLKPKFNRWNRHASFTGRLTAGGTAVAGAPVTLYHVYSDSEDDRVVRITRTHTGPDGTYRFSRRVKHTGWFETEAGGSTAACVDPSTAPAGCIDETLALVDSRHVRVTVRRRH